ncbi:MAG: HPF/RaiA family ribosome-associated protein [Solirubrobacterales bacterium]
MDVDVTLRGEVPDEARDLAEEKIGALDRYVNTQFIRGHVVLRMEANPRIERPARAEGEVLLDGRMLRAHVASFDMTTAVDQLAQRLERQLRAFVERRVGERDRGAARRAGEQEAGDRAESRPAFTPRSSGDREVVRSKSFAFGEMDAVEAAAEMEMLDHDFYLYRDADSEVDAVVYRRDDGRTGVIGPLGTGWDGPDEDGIVREDSRGPEPRRLDDVVAEMNELNHRFLYFVDEESGRARVIYLRFDGNYGLIELDA